MNAARQLASTALVTLFAQPYDTEANGFYFTDMASYEAQAVKNLNAFGGVVEEYEFQYIDGEGSQKLLEILPLSEFFEIVETWKSDDIEKIDILAELVGWHYIGDTADDIKSKLDDLIIYSDNHSEDSLGQEVMENLDSETYQLLKDRDLTFYFDFVSWMKDLSSGSTSSVFRIGGTYYFAEYAG